MQNKYVIEVIEISKNTDLESKCNAITFLNTGSNIVKINNVSLQPNGIGSLSIQGNVGEIDSTVYKIDFGVNVTGNLIQVIKKNDLWQQ